MDYFGIPYDDWNLPCDMKWGILVSGGVYGLVIEEEEVKGKNIKNNLWSGTGKDVYGAVKQKVALSMSQDLFLFLIFYTSSLTVESVKQPLSHTPDTFIEKWLKQVNSEKHKKVGQKKVCLSGQIGTARENKTTKER